MKNLFFGFLIYCSSMVAYAAANVQESMTKAHLQESVPRTMQKASPIIRVAKPNNSAQKPLINTAKIKTIDRIVVFVNKTIITSQQVDTQVNQTLYNFKEKGLKPPAMADLRHQVIEQLIMQQIQLDLAARSGIKTSDLETTNAIDNIVKQQKMTLPQLKATLSTEGINFATFRQQIQNQITIDKLKQREINGRANVSDDEVNRILSSEAYKNRIEYDLSDIIVGVPEQATESVVVEKENLAKQAYNALKSGQSFSQVAIKYSNAPNALSGGELGWKSSAALPAVIASKLEGLPVGGFTDVIRLPVGFFIFKVNNIKKHGTVQIVKQYHVRHILIKVNENNSDEEAHNKILWIKAALDKDVNNPTKLNQDFIKYAKQYSEDTSSINGGDLSWVSRGDTVPAFEEAILNTPVGVVSEPIRSPFGWHLLEVMATRESNMTNDLEKAALRQELRESKATMIYNQWLRDIREMSYVKMNDE